MIKRSLLHPTTNSLDLPKTTTIKRMAFSSQKISELADSKNSLTSKTKKLLKRSSLKEPNKKTKITKN